MDFELPKNHFNEDIETKFDKNSDQKLDIKMKKNYGLSSTDQTKLFKIILIVSNIIPLFVLITFSFLVLVSLIYWFILISFTLIGSGILFTIPFVLTFTLLGISVAAVFLLMTSFISRDTLATYFSWLDQIDL